LKANTLNDNPTDVTETLDSVNAAWTKLKTEKEKALTDSLAKKLRNIVSADFDILQWSDDETKILYIASQSATIDQIIKPALIGTNSTPEDRNIEKGKVYVYDIKEDRNYKILDAKPESTLVWYPDSKHLIYVHDKKIDIMEYDGQNQTTVYAGPFVDGYVFPWPDATKLVILTNLGNSSLTPNLYTIELK
jgi:Tol biopolymer transport system component